MRRLRVTVAIAATLAGIMTACGTGPSEPTSQPSATSSSSTTTTGAPAAAAAPASTPVDGACDREEALAAIRASGAAEGGGHVEYLECLDGFGWALYSLGAEAAHVVLSVTADGYEVLNLGTSLCPLDSGMPADVAMAIAPSPAAANDCPAPGSTGGEGVVVGDSAPDDEGHQPWREACAEDPTAYAGCQP
ncbi:MAG TPA: hypothetical protein VFR26_12370 [Acidimicrobiales bacterium]|nr:hypothetical protein [Acidimicrobiales bacterium]